MPSESTMTIAGLRLPITETSRGPKVAKTVPSIEPLAWLVNIALEEPIPDLVATLERRHDFHYDSIHAVSEGGGMYRLSVDFVTTNTRLPASTIIEIITTLSALQKPRVPRVVPQPVDAPPGRTPAEPLVRPPLPASWQELERNAAELERLVARERTPEHLTEEARLRRILWHDMSDLGVFERVPVPLPEGTPTLHAYQAASQQLGKYLESEERAKFNPDARPTRIVDAPVSVDWFRVPSQPGPSRFSPLGWLGYLEWLLGLSERIGDHGEIFARIDEHDWWTLHWRAEDGEHPAVVRVTHTTK
jgi:hypothetical protein